MYEKLMDDMAKINNSLISALRYEKDKQFLLKMPLEEYSIEAWSYGLSYVYSKTLHFNSYDEIKKYIEQNQ